MAEGKIYDGLALAKDFAMIVGNDPCRFVLAPNSNMASRVEFGNPDAKAKLATLKDGLVELILQGPEKTDTEWSVHFKAD